MNMVVSAVTHKGVVRTTNEDSMALGQTILGSEATKPICIQIDPSCPTVLLADGMGGHVAGQVASRLALTALIRASTAEADRHAWEAAIRLANRELYEAMQRDKTLAGMGTTIVGVSIAPDAIIHFNVGDSRLYRFASGILTQLSRDDVPGSPNTDRKRMSHGITQSIGGHTRWIEVFPHVGVTEALDGTDRLLLCTDGLTDMVEESEILAALSNECDPTLCVDRLLRQALVAGGTDNVSLAIVQKAAKII